MAEPATQPNASSSNAKPRKLKSPKEKSQQQRQQQRHKVAVSPDDAAARAVTTTTSAAAAAAATTPKDGGVLLASYDVEFDYGAFDYDAVKADEGASLWLVRAPTSVKAKSLDGLEVAQRMGLVGELVRKNAAYDLWALEPAGAAQAPAGGSGDGDKGGLGGAHAGHVGAEELNHLSVLLPCKRKGGKLFLAPKPVTRHLVVAARPAKPTRPDATSDAAATAFENPKREAYPDEILTHRFRPYGDPGDHPPEHHMDVDAAEVGAKEKERHKRKGSETGSSKRKKAKLAAS